VEWGEREGGSKGALLQLERHGRIKPACGRWSAGGARQDGAEVGSPGDR
jgi:hypothetical protein